MRTNRQVVLVGLALVLMAGSASADGVAGTYDVKYEEVSTNCNSPLKYPYGKLVVTATKGAGIMVDIKGDQVRTPLMLGSVGKGGKISAKSKSGATAIGGMNGVFSVAGKITPEGMLTLVMVGEYSAGGKALCSQSWNVVGAKADPEPAAPKTPPKKKASTDAGVSMLPALLRD